jgi:hypothetical protein
VGVWLLDRGDIWGGVGLPSFVTNNKYMINNKRGVLLETMTEYRVSLT